MKNETMKRGRINRRHKKEKKIPKASFIHRGTHTKGRGRQEKHELTLF